MSRVKPKKNLEKALWSETFQRQRAPSMRKADAKLAKFAEKAECGKCYTLHEIAVAMGVTRERVRQIEARALRKLNKRLGQVFKNENITPEDAMDMVRKVSTAALEHALVGGEGDDE